MHSSLIKQMLIAISLLWGYCISAFYVGECKVTKTIRLNLLQSRLPQSEKEVKVIRIEVDVSQ